MKPMRLLVVLLQGLILCPLQEGECMKKYDELTFTDDFLFSKILYHNTDLCRELLEVILNKKIREIRAVEYQKTVDVRYNSRGVRFDVYAENDEEVYDIEMQVADDPDMVLRSRYYHSMLDMDQLEKGDNYSVLKPTYVIFLCKNKCGIIAQRPVSTYTMTCREDSTEELDDGVVTIIVNAAMEHAESSGKSDELSSLLRYIHTGSMDREDSRLVRRIEQEVIDARQHRKWRADYMTYEEHLERAYDKGLEQGREEGLERGVEKGQIQERNRTIETLRAKGYTEEQIHDMLDLDK